MAESVPNVRTIAPWERHMTVFDSFHRLAVRGGACEG